MDGKFSAECSHPFMLRRAQHERVTAFREVIFDEILNRGDKKEPRLAL
jgi:hypothetical protein